MLRVFCVLVFFFVFVFVLLVCVVTFFQFLLCVACCAVQCLNCWSGCVRVLSLLFYRYAPGIRLGVNFCAHHHQAVEKERKRELKSTCIDRKVHHASSHGANFGVLG